MRHSPDHLEPHDVDPARRAFLRILGAGGLAVLASGCVGGGALDEMTSLPEALRQQREREALFRFGPEVYGAMADHTVGLALPGLSGMAEVVGQGVVVQRIGPDNRIYRALLTARHVIVDSRTGKRKQLRVLPRADAPHDRFRENLIGVDEHIRIDNAPYVERQRWVVDPKSDLAAIPLSGIHGHNDLLDLPGIEVEDRPILQDDPVMALGWTHGEARNGWRGLEPIFGDALRRQLIAEMFGERRNGEIPTTFPSYSGNSGGGVFRLDNPEHPKNPRLAGIQSFAARRVGYGSIIIDSDKIRRFLWNYAKEINAQAR